MSNQKVKISGFIPINKKRFLKGARFALCPDLFEGDSDDDYFCGLSSRITPTKCFLYLNSGTRTCLDCAAKLKRVRELVESGEIASYKKAPILGFHMTSLTGLPGVPSDLKAYFDRRDFRPAKTWVPISKRERIERQLRAEAKKVEKRKPGRPPKVKEEVIETTSQVRGEEKPTKQRYIRRKKAVWIEKCDGCHKVKEIHSYGFCKECLDAGK